MNIADNIKIAAGGLSILGASIGLTLNSSKVLEWANYYPPVVEITAAEVTSGPAMRPFTVTVKRVKNRDCTFVSFNAYGKIRGSSYKLDVGSSTSTPEKVATISYTAKFPSPDVPVGRYSFNATIEYLCNGIPRTVNYPAFVEFTVEPEPPIVTLHSATVQGGKAGDWVPFFIDAEKHRPCKLDSVTIMLEDSQNVVWAVDHQIRSPSYEPFPRNMYRFQIKIPEGASSGLTKNSGLRLSYENCRDNTVGSSLDPQRAHIPPFMIWK